MTEYIQTEEAMRRVNRALTTLRASNHALIRASTEEDFVQQVCRTTVELGGYLMAWVGYAEHDTSRTVRPVSHFGGDSGYLDTALISWNDSPAGQGPAGTAIRTGKLAIMHAMNADASDAPWRVVALARGYVSSIALPLIGPSGVFGALAINAADPDAFDDPEEVGLLLKMAEDLTYGITARRTQRERESAEAALRESEERYRRFVETACEGIVQLDTENRVVFVNQAMADMLGYTVQEMMGVSAFAFIYEREHDDVKARLERMRWGLGEQFERTYRRKDGSLLLARASANPLFDSHGRHLGLLSMITDETERRQSEVKLHESEQRFRATFELAAVGIAHVSPTGAFLRVNQRLCDIVGYTRDELLKGTFQHITYPLDLNADLALVEKTLADEIKTFALEKRYVRKDGSLVWSNLTVSLVRGADAAPQYFISVVEDITARKRMESELERANAAAEELARVRQEQARAAETMSEVSAALGSALDLGDLYALVLQQAGKVLPFDHARILAPRDGWLTMVAARGEPSTPRGSRLLHVPETKPFWARVRQGRPVLIRDTLDDPDWVDVPPRVGPFRLRSLISIPMIVEGKLLGLFDVASTAPNRYGEQHLQIATVFRDRLTQALRNVRLFEAEQQRTRAAEELAQLREDFVAAVSHELRTPLTTIVGNAELLQGRWDSLSEERRLERVSRIVVAAGRQQRLVEDLLLISQLETDILAPQLLAVPLAPLAHEAADVVRMSYAGQQVDVRGPEGLLVLGDPARIVQVLVNLIDNAAKYSPEGSPVALSWQAEDEMAVVRVRDNGSGVPEEGRDRLFTRFGRVPDSRIRAGRVGTGLGLFLGRQLAEAMNGDLDLESTGPTGSTFRLRLKRA